jgi:hypothetical protein
MKAREGEPSLRVSRFHLLPSPSRDLFEDIEVDVFESVDVQTRFARLVLLDRDAT